MLLPTITEIVTYYYASLCTAFSPEFFTSGGALCIINDLGGLVNNGCGKLHVREFVWVASCNTEKQSELVKGQLTLFGERASSDTDNLSKSCDGVFCEYCSSQMAQEHKVVSDTGGSG